MANSDTVEIGSGPIRFHLHYSDQLNDQGVTMNVYGDVDGQDVEILRFDCFDHAPHYHYGPEKLDERLMLDKTTEGDPARLDARPATHPHAGHDAPRRLR